ncbi:MAG: DUF3256 family protein [Dysgonomonas sp.]
MKKTLLILSFITAAVFTVNAQELESIILSMPSDIILGLDATQKDKLLANAKDTAQITVERETVGAVERLAISPDYISLQTSEAGTTQIKLLPLINDTKIICVVKTVCGKACDSQIQFYTTKWIPIAQGLFPKKTKEWFIKSDVDKDSQDFKNAYAALDMTPIKMTLSPDGTSLDASYDIKNYLPEDDYKKIQPFLIEGSKTFQWDKISYK